MPNFVITWPFYSVDFANYSVLKPPTALRHNLYYPSLFWLKGKALSWCNLVIHYLWFFSSIAIVKFILTRGGNVQLNLRSEERMVDMRRRVTPDKPHLRTFPFPPKNTKPSRHTHSFRQETPLVQQCRNYLQHIVVCKLKTRFNWIKSDERLRIPWTSVFSQNGQHDDDG